MSESQTQADVNNATTAVTALLTDVQGATSTILSDLTAIQQQIANGQVVDTTALDSTIATVTGIQSSLDSAVSSLTNVAVPPAPPVTQ